MCTNEQTIYLMRNNKNTYIHLINLESNRFSPYSLTGHPNQKCKAILRQALHMASQNFQILHKMICNLPSQGHCVF